ncbi:hypothetical protein F3Y22_tig00110890pilonHSYRG00347 [Hibiscus syriacus]|uniref:MYND-type domain-containing protein n=1 Tax=Hibiscus syriacus TaxID=106335 RepID=A0A6A2ZI68_HIBSY|nr:hypothetical protein F3Y22_tig00110890pilonHSYRG00347 [Hibiscus syriacus]
MRARNWHISADCFLVRRFKTGNIEACYTLGMSSEQVPCTSALLSRNHTFQRKRWLQNRPESATRVNVFLKEWFEESRMGKGLKLCGHEGCGWPETKVYEFERCGCGTVFYCSRVCQWRDWGLRHGARCESIIRFLAAAAVCRCRCRILRKLKSIP